MELHKQIVEYEHVLYVEGKVFMERKEKMYQPDLKLKINLKTHRQDYTQIIDNRYYYICSRFRLKTT